MTIDMNLSRGLRAVAAFGCSVLVLAACGSDTAGTSDTSAPGDVLGDTAVGDDAAGDTAGDTGESGPQWDNACDEGQSCEGGRLCRSAVCVAEPPPGAESFLADPSSNVAVTERPDLACADQTPEPPTSTVTTTMYGAVARFGDGRQTGDMRVDVLLAEGFDPVACEGISDQDDRKACYRGHGTVVGTALSVAVAALDPKPACTGHGDCPLGYQCFDPDDLGEGACEAQFGIFEIADVPLDTPLVIRTYPTVSERRWHDTYNFGVILYPEYEVDGKVQYDATMVSEGQWQLTPNSVGMPAIDEDNGVIGGRVRDCRQGDRDSWPISEVSVDLAARARGVVYFNDLEDDTVPLIDRTSTNILGRFAALDVPSGWNIIAGSARVEGTTVSAGALPVYVIPDALSIVSWPGRRPFWRQN